MYFPFLTCEGKCGAAALDIADRQNAYNMVLSKRVSFEPNGVVRVSKRCYFLITPRIASTLTIEKTCPFPRRLRFRICIL